MKTVILASTSPYRKMMLERLLIPFQAIAPDVDETALRGEQPHNLVQRLALAKAQAIATMAPHAIIIGGDQVAVCEEKIIGKPHTLERAREQLRFLSGRKIVFHTGLCVLDAESGAHQVDDIVVTVFFRHLDEAMINRYLEREPALNCAGSFKSESLGIALCDRIESDDPSALIGLPLIRLRQMLEHFGVQIV